MRSRILALTFIAALSTTVAFAGNKCEEVFHPKPYADRSGHAPMVQNTTFELFRVTHPSGKENGESFHFRVREEMIRKIYAAEGAAFTKQVVDIYRGREAFFNFLGFRVEKHDLLGEYWSEFPSPELLNFRLEKWNEIHKSNPLMQVHVRFETTGADAQIKMLRLWMDRYTIGVADPFNGFKEFYIPNGSAPPSQELLNTVEIAKRREGNRVREHNTLHRHDMDQIANSLFLNKSYLEATRRVQEFWSEALKVVANDKRDVQGPAVTAMMKAFEGVTTARGERPFAGRSGMTPAEIIRVFIHHGQRGLHSITHILSWLIVRPQGIDPATFVEKGRGLSFEIELSIHLAGLGRRAPGASAPGYAPNLLLNWARASEHGGPVTLESSLAYTTNAEIRRIREFVALVNDPALNQLFNDFTKAGKLDEVSTQTVSMWANEIRESYRASY